MFEGFDKKLEIFHQFEYFLMIFFYIKDGMCLCRGILAKNSIRTFQTLIYNMHEPRNAKSCLFPAFDVI